LSRPRSARPSNRGDRDAQRPGRRLGGEGQAAWCSPSSGHVYGHNTGLPRREEEVLQPVCPKRGHQVVGGTAVRGLLRAAWDGVGAAALLQRVRPSAGGEQSLRGHAPSGSCGTCSLAGGPTIPRGGSADAGLAFSLGRRRSYATLLAATTPRAAGQVYNIAAGPPQRTFVDLVATLKQPSRDTAGSPWRCLSVRPGRCINQADHLAGRGGPGLLSGAGIWRTVYGGVSSIHAEPYAGKNRRSMSHPALIIRATRLWCGGGGWDRWEAQLPPHRSHPPHRFTGTSVPPTSISRTDRGLGCRRAGRGCATGGL